MVAVNGIDFGVDRCWFRQLMWIWVAGGDSTS